MIWCLNFNKAVKRKNSGHAQTEEKSEQIEMSSFSWFTMAEPVRETDIPFGEIAKERLDQSLLSFNEVPKWLARTLWAHLHAHLRWNGEKGTPSKSVKGNQMTPFLFKQQK